MSDVDNINCSLGCAWRFAIVDGVRLDIEDAQRAQHGSCPLCGSRLVAKKGDIRAHHWCHIDKNNQCDDWYQPKGRWHLYWQNKFPEEMQEVVIQRDSLKHIADIKTNMGIVLEVQYSPMTAAEARKRECFYDTMMWIVSMTRDEHDRNFLEEFEKHKNRLSQANQSLWSLENQFEKILPSAWVNSQRFLWLDCYGTMLNPESDEDLICIVPKVNDDAFRICARVNRDKFISMCFDGSILEFERELKEIRDAYNDPHRKREQDKRAWIKSRKDAHKKWEEYRAKDLADQEERKRKLKEDSCEEIFSDEVSKKTVDFLNFRYREEFRVGSDFNWNENLITKTVCLEISWIELWALSRKYIFSIFCSDDSITGLCEVKLCFKPNYTSEDYQKDYEWLSQIVDGATIKNLPKYEDLIPYKGKCIRVGLMQPDSVAGKVVFHNLRLPKKI
ncbi:MAG: hypothetical protein J6Q84_01615 [Kiritimatiellae bacterium]|nr:hypothetical protein [Kiritimatiellia bacterium]